MSKYHSGNTSRRTVDEIREALMAHPDNVDRLDTLALLFDWRRAREKHITRFNKQAVQDFDKKMGDEKSPSLRALTLVHELNGDHATYFKSNLDEETSYSAAMNILFNDAVTNYIVLDVERLENMARYPIVALLPMKNMIDFGDIGYMFNEKAEATTDEAEDFVEKNFVHHAPTPPTPGLQ